MINKHDEPNTLRVKASLVFDIDISQQILTEQSLVSFAELKLIFQIFLTLSLTFRQLFFDQYEYLAIYLWGDREQRKIRARRTVFSVL